MKTGRPKLKHGLAKSVQIGVRFTPERFRIIKAAQRRNEFWEGKLIGRWAGEVLYAYALKATMGTFEIVKPKKKIPKNFVGWQTERITHRV